MDSPSQPTLSRIALGALDVNKHLHSPHGSPKKSPAKKHTFVFSDNAEQPPARNLKELLLEAEVPVLRQTPVRVVSVSPPRSEKRKEAPTDVEGREEDVLGRAKFAKVKGREMGSLSPAHELEMGDAVGGDASMEGDEGLEVCYSSLTAEDHVLIQNSQPKGHPFVLGHHRYQPRFYWISRNQQPSPLPTPSPTPQENLPPQPPKLIPPNPSSARYIPPPIPYKNQDPPTNTPPRTPQPSACA